MEPPSPGPAGTLASGTALALAGVLLLALLWLVLRRRETGRRFTAALAFLALAFGIEAATPLAPASWQPAARAIALLACLFAVVRGLAVGIDLLARQRRAHFSTILRDVVTVVLYALVVLIVLRTTLDVDLTALLATSAVATAVIGFALQETLGNVFSGLALQVQKPFDPGDWIRVGSHVGRVQGIGWRSTAIVTKSLEILDIPNAQLSKDVVTNYHGAAIGDRLTVAAGFDVPPNEVKAAILDVLARNPEVAEVPVARVETIEWGEFAMKYSIRFWMTDYARSEQIRDAILTNVWYAFRRHGIAIPLPARVLALRDGGPAPDHEARRADRRAALRQVDFLRALDDADLDLLEASAREVAFGAGEPVCREGDVSDGFFVLRRGTVEVATRAGSAETRVAELRAPAFFGEMALLTGAPRAATVRAQTDADVLLVERAGFERLFQARPAVAEAVSRVLAERRSELLQRRQEAAAGEPPETRSRRLLATMKAIFRF